MAASSEIWNSLFRQVTLRRANLSANLFFVYADALRDFETLRERYLGDRRREWTSLRLTGGDRSPDEIMEFSSRLREPVRFLIERAGSVGNVECLWAFTTVSGPLRSSTLESFIDWAPGFWFPRLSYRFMDDLTPVLREVFGEARIDISEFVANVFERGETGALTRQKTTRTWVEREGDREYDLLRDLNLQVKRIVTLSGARWAITFPDQRGKLDIRIDHRSRVLLSTPHFDEFRRILDLILGEAKQNLSKYELRKRLQAQEGVSDAGERVVFVDYAGTEALVLRIQDSEADWFDSLRAILVDPTYLTENERVVPFVLTEETNPLVQAQLVDLEAQATYTLTASKSDNQIVIAPEENEAHAGSIAKIVNIIEKVAGATAVEA